MLRHLHFESFPIRTRNAVATKFPSIWNSQYNSNNSRPPVISSKRLLVKFGFWLNEGHSNQLGQCLRYRPCRAAEVLGASTYLATPFFQTQAPSKRVGILHGYIGVSFPLPQAPRRNGRVAKKRVLTSRTDHHKTKSKRFQNRGSIEKQSPWRLAGPGAGGIRQGVVRVTPAQARNLCTSLHRFRGEFGLHKVCTCTFTARILHTVFFPRLPNNS